MKLNIEIMRYVDGVTISDKVVTVDCNFVADKMEGPGSVSISYSLSIIQQPYLYLQIEFNNGDVMFCNFTRGVVHGLTKTFNLDKKLVHMSWYQNGTPFGTSWQYCQGGGYLVGTLDLNGNFSGGNLTFLYPDFSTALNGNKKQHS